MDEDGPEDGDESQDDSGKAKRPPRENLILLPGGRTADPRKDLGVDYVENVSKNGFPMVSPEVVDPVAIDAEVRERDRFVSSQKLVEVIKRQGSTTEIGDAILSEIAEELSHLKFERRKASTSGKNTASYSASRITGLRGLADLILKRLEASRTERLDLKSPRLQSIFKVWFECFYDAMEKTGVEPHVIDLVIQQMKADMVGWEKRMDGAETD